MFSQFEKKIVKNFDKSNLVHFQTEVCTLNETHHLVTI